LPHAKGFDTSARTGLFFPFALSLSKGAFVPHDKGFDRLSPNGDNTGLRYLSPNGTFLSVRPEPVEGPAELALPIALSLSKGAFVP
jgi:hypothetical protein